MENKIMDNEKYRVLMIEDNKLDQMAFKRLVETEKLQYDYTIAGSVAQAQKVLTCQKFDIVISDYLLGDGTAFDLLDLVKNTPVIVVTGIGNEEVAVKTWRAGAYDYLTKDKEGSYLKTLPITVENAISHKRAEENLRLLSGAIMSTVDSVYITDLEDKITFVNKAFCDSYGYKREEIVGKNSNVLWLAGNKSANTRTVFKTHGLGDTWEIGFYHRRKNGGLFPVSLSRSIIKDSNGNKIAVVGTVRDITERVLVEDELRKTNHRLKEQDRLKNELAIWVSEAVTRLLPAPRGADENVSTRGCLTALDIPGQACGEPVEPKSDTLSNLDTAKRLINDYLNILLIDTGRLKLQPANLDISEVISNLVEELSAIAGKKGVELKSNTAGLELIVLGERDRLVQALTSIIEYTINVTPSKGRIEVHLKDAGSEIAVEVRNNGTLVEGSNINKIFNCFELVKEQSGPLGDALRHWNPEQKTALSLSAAQKIVELHGGWVWVENADDGSGNSLFISLPKPGIREKHLLADKKVQLCEAN
jgi:PAS domain S-box-containing protein